MNKHQDLITLFVNNFINYVNYKKSQDNDYIIDTEILCDVNDIANDEKIKLNQVRRYNSVKPFFNQFRGLYRQKENEHISSRTTDSTSKSTTSGYKKGFFLKQD